MKVSNCPNWFYFVNFLIIFSSSFFLMTSNVHMNDFKFAIFYLSICAIAFSVTHFIFIPKLILINIKAGLFGYDIYWKEEIGFEEKIAESLGLAPYISFAASLLTLHSFFTFFKYSKITDAIFFQLAYITFGTFLGFVDDVLELRWRHKLVYPFFFSMPLILSY